jgi:ribosome-associated protein
MTMQSLAVDGMIAHLTASALWALFKQVTTQGEDLQGKTLQDFVIDKIDDLKGQDIIVIDVKGKSSITDCMIICTGTSSRHVISIADHVVQQSRAAGLMPLGVEGENDADWVVVDLGDVIVHVMQDESRRLYELEKLWG